MTGNIMYVTCNMLLREGGKYYEYVSNITREQVPKSSDYARKEYIYLINNL